MANTVADLVAKLRLDAGEFTSGLGGVTSSLSGFGSILAPLAATVAGVFAVDKLIDFGTEAVTMAGKMEQTNIAFETMLGSAEKAGQFLGELKTFAAQTPFEFPDLLQASKRMMALGFEATQVIPTLRTIGDAVAGLGGGSEMINRVTLALGQMQAKGKVSAEEMRQLAEAGIPAWQMLADKIGASIPEAMKAAEQGLISASTALPAILEGMNEKFGGLMEQQSTTLLGQWSNFKDQLTFLMTDLGTALLPMLQGILSAVQPLVASFGEWAKGVAEQLGPTLKAFGEGLGELLAGLTTGNPLFTALVDALTAVADVVVRIGEPLWEIVRPIAELVAMLGGPILIAGLRHIESAFRAIGTILDIVKPAIDLVVKAFSDWIGGLKTLLEWAGKIPGMSKVFQSSMVDVETKTKDATTALKSQSDALRATSTAASGAKTNIEGLGDKQKKAKDETILLTKAEVDYQVKLLDQKQKVEDAKKAHEEWIAAVKAGKLDEEIADLNAKLQATVDISRNIKTIAVPAIGTDLLQAASDASAGFAALTIPIAGIGTGAQTALGTAKSAIDTFNKDAPPVMDTAMKSVSTAVTNAAQDMVGILIGTEKGSFMDALKSLGTGVMSSFVEPAIDAFKNFIENGIKAAIGWLTGEGGLLSSLSSVGSAIKGVFTGGTGAAAQGGVSAAGQGAGGVAGAAGGAAGLGGSLLSGGIAAAGGVAGGLITGFMLTGDLGKIEENTRKAQIGIVGENGLLDRINLYLPFLETINDYLWSKFHTPFIELVGAGNSLRWDLIPLVRDGIKDGFLPYLASIADTGVGGLHSLSEIAHNTASLISELRSARANNVTINNYSAVPEAVIAALRAQGVIA